MSITDQALDFLDGQTAWSYHPGSAPASEPTAWAALALAAYGRQAAAQRARDGLAAAQTSSGAVGVRRDGASPGWPTPLAILAWNLVSPTRDGLGSDAASSEPTDREHAAASGRAVQWLLSIRGNTSGRPPYTGHDTTLAGWPWVEGTHSWIEPTALSVLALKAVGQGDHPRTQEAERLLLDRLLAGGGCNYGNTVVLGQELLPHVQPTGLALLALVGSKDPSGRVERSLAWLEGSLSSATAPASLAYGLMGLAAYDRWPVDADAWLAAAAARSLAGGSSLELALVALARLRSDGPLVLNRAPARAAESVQ
ncbi:MAG: hypothetical protein HYX69_02595 [Planctomycetia bacterium]|nr:hypothetical protein [Planctomycetia bacterium]